MSVSPDKCEPLPRRSTNETLRELNELRFNNTNIDTMIRAANCGNLQGAMMWGPPTPLNHNDQDCSGVENLRRTFADRRDYYARMERLMAELVELEQVGGTVKFTA